MAFDHTHKISSQPSNVECSHRLMQKHFSISYGWFRSVLVIQTEDIAGFSLHHFLRTVLGTGLYHCGIKPWFCIALAVLTPTDWEIVSPSPSAELTWFGSTSTTLIGNSLDFTLKSLSANLACPIWVYFPEPTLQYAISRFSATKHYFEDPFWYQH